MIEASLFVLDTPRCKCVSRREVAKRSAANWLHGSFTPTDGLPEPPSLPAADWIPLGLWLDGSTIMLFVGYGETEGYPIFGVSIGSLTTFHRYLLVGRSWCTAPHAYAHHNHKEEVFGEWLFGCQGTILFTPHKGKQGGGFRPLTLSPMGNYEFPLIIKIFFWFFLSACPYACKPPFVKYQRECSLKLF